MNNLQHRFSLFFVLIFFLISFCTASNIVVAQSEILLLNKEVQIKPFRATFPFLTSDTVKITFIGDLMQHSPQISSARRLAVNGEKYNYTHTFKYVKDLLKKSNINVANMEFTVGNAPYSGYPCFRAPYDIADAANNNGINLFLTANNHIGDLGSDGIKQTISYYKDKCYPNTGTCNTNIDSAYIPHIRIINGIKFAFINFTYGTNGNKIKVPYAVNLMDSTKIISAINKAKYKDAEIIIINPHWGNEYELKASKKQKEWAKMLFRHGADIIIGSHPHVPQDYEIYTNNKQTINKAVFYSLGNFVSNQNTPNYTRIAMVVSISFVKEKLTNKIDILMPEWQYFWCFKPNEFEKGYTVAPIDKILNKTILPCNTLNNSTTKNAILKMENTYKQFKSNYSR